MKKIHRIAAILLSSVLLLAVGCAKPIDLPEKPTADMAAEPAEATESVLDDEAVIRIDPNFPKEPSLSAGSTTFSPNLRFTSRLLTPSHGIMT